MTEEELEQAKGQRDLADQRLRIHMEQVQTLRAQTEAESEQCKTLYLEMREASREQIPVCLETALEEMKAFYVLAVQDEQRQREEERQYQEEALRFEKLTDLIRREEEKFSALQERENRLREDEGALLAETASLKTQWEEQKKRLPMEQKREAEERRIQIVGRLEQLSQRRQETEREAERLKQEEGTLKGQQEAEEKNGRRLEEQRTLLKSEFAERARRSGFANEGEYRKAICTEAERARLSEEISDYEAQTAAARERANQCKEALKGASEESEDEVKPQLAGLLEELSQARELSLKAAAARTEYEKAYGAVKELLKERRELMEKYQLIHTLYITADGKMSQTARLDFQTFVQRQYFSQMIYAANRRLKRMTEGRFILKCRDLEALSLQGEAGLDLDVYSVETDSVRNVKTLSGGEAFLAALAMALGMADVIQDTAGSVEMGALFIDEGFGSLDDEARARAIAVLKELSGGKRMIGIISHVAELREQIEKKITVKRGEEGSLVRVETE